MLTQVTRNVDIGSVFGELTVVEYAGKDKWGAPLYICVCSCNNQTRTKATALKCGRSTKCKHHPKPVGHAAKHSLFYQYQYAARKRNLEFSISESYFITLTTQICYYCGCAPSQIIGAKRKNGPFIYNGIDRLDNNKGYTISNTVACCKRCNRAKYDMSPEQFIELAKQIASNHKDI
jgi:hypothetical protein